MSQKTIAFTLALAALFIVGHEVLGRGAGGAGGAGGGGRGGFGGGGGGMSGGDRGGYGGSFSGAGNYGGFGGASLNNTGAGSVRYSGGQAPSGNWGRSDYRPSNYGSIQNNKGSGGWETNANRSAQRPGSGGGGNAWVSPNGKAVAVQGPRGGAAAAARGPEGGSISGIRTAYGARGGMVRGPAGGAVGGVEGPRGGSAAGVRGPGGNGAIAARGPYGGRGIANLPSGSRPENWHGNTYYHWDHHFYRPYWWNNSVYYWPVGVPIGYYYPTLPSDAIQYTDGSGNNYYYYDGSYFQPSQQDGQSGYVAVEGPNQPPPDASQAPQFTNAPPDPFDTLKKACAFLAAQPQFTLNVEDTFDEVNDTGQKVQFTSTRTVSVQRPDRLAVDFSSDDQQRHVVYDGSVFTALDSDKNLYSTLAQKGSLDELLDTLAKKYNMAMPLDDLLYSNAYDRLAGNIQAGQYVGQDTIDGVACDHLAFRQEGADWEVWIEQGPTPMIRKVSIDYSGQPGDPRYVFEVTQWNAKPIAGSVFQMNLPKDAKQIDMLPAAEPSAETPQDTPPPAPSPGLQLKTN